MFVSLLKMVEVVLITSELLVEVKYTKEWLQPQSMPPANFLLHEPCF